MRVQRLLPFGIAVLAVGLALVLVLGGILTSTDTESPQEDAVIARPTSLAEAEEEDPDDDDGPEVPAQDDDAETAFLVADDFPLLSTAEDTGLLSVESYDAGDSLATALSENPPSMGCLQCRRW